MRIATDTQTLIKWLQQTWQQPLFVRHHTAPLRRPASLLWMLVLAGCAGTTRYIRDDRGRENDLSMGRFPAL